MKKLTKILSMLLLAGAFVLAAPKNEVKADTNVAAMNYDQACQYWASTPLWKQIYDLESAKSGYLDNAKADLLTYFKVSLNDYIWKPEVVIASRPLTSNFLRDAITLSGASLTNVVRGNVSNGISLYSVLYNEVKSEVCNIPESEANRIAGELVNCLRGHNVTTSDQYDRWRREHGCSAFAFFMRGYNRNCFACAPCGYNWCCGAYGWGWYNPWGACYAQAVCNANREATQKQVDFVNSAVNQAVDNCQMISDICQSQSNDLNNLLNSFAGM